MNSKEDRDSRGDIEELKRLKEWVVLCPNEASIQLQEFKSDSDNETKKNAEFHKFLNQRGVESSLDSHIIDVAMEYIRRLEGELCDLQPSNSIERDRRVMNIINNPKEVGSYTKEALKRYQRYQGNNSLDKVKELEEKLERERRVRRYLRKKHDKYKQAIEEAEGWCDGEANIILNRALRDKEA